MLAIVSNRKLFPRKKNQITNLIWILAWPPWLFPCISSDVKFFQYGLPEKENKWLEHIFEKGAELFRFPMLNQLSKKNPDTSHKKYNRNHAWISSANKGCLLRSTNMDKKLYLYHGNINTIKVW